MNYSIRFSYEDYADTNPKPKRFKASRVITATSEPAARQLAQELLPNFAKLNSHIAGSMRVDDVVALG